MITIYKHGIKHSIHKWFYDFNICLSIFLSFNAFIYFFDLILILSDIYCSCESENGHNGISDKKIFILNQINGINVRDFEFLEEFDDLNKKELIELIF